MNNWRFFVENAIATSCLRCVFGNWIRGNEMFWDDFSEKFNLPLLNDLKAKFHGCQETNELVGEVKKKLTWRTAALTENELTHSPLCLRNWWVRGHSGWVPPKSLHLFELQTKPSMHRTHANHFDQSIYLHKMQWPNVNTEFSVALRLHFQLFDFVDLFHFQFNVFSSIEMSIFSLVIKFRLKCFIIKYF